MTGGKTTLIKKDPLKGIAPTKYRPTTCYPMMWKILATQISEQMYYLLISRGIFSGEQKVCCKRNKGAEELLYIDHTSSTKVKRYGKMLLCIGSTAKKITIWFPKAGYYTVSKCIKYTIKFFCLSRRPSKRVEWNRHQDGLLSLFNGISTFVGYLMRKPIFLEEQ